MPCLVIEGAVLSVILFDSAMFPLHNRCVYQTVDNHTIKLLINVMPVILNKDMGWRWLNHFEHCFNYSYFYMILFYFRLYFIVVRHTQLHTDFAWKKV